MIDRLKKFCEPYGILVILDYIFFVIVYIYIYSAMEIGKLLWHLRQYCDIHYITVMV